MGPNEERGQSAYWVIDNEPKNQSSSFENSTYKSYTASDLDSGLLVTNGGLRPQVPKYSMPCPPNVKLDDSYQTSHIDSLLEATETYEEDYVKKKFPTLAKIIFDDTGDMNPTEFDQNLNYLYDGVPIGAPLHSTYHHDSHLLDATNSAESAANSRLFDSVFMKPRESTEEVFHENHINGFLNDLPELYQSNDIPSPSTDSKASDLYDFSSDNSFGHLYEDLDFDSEMGVMGGNIPMGAESL